MYRYIAMKEKDKVANNHLKNSKILWLLQLSNGILDSLPWKLIVFSTTSPEAEVELGQDNSPNCRTHYSYHLLKSLYTINAILVLPGMREKARFMSSL